MSKIPCAPTFFGGQKILVSLRWPPPLSNPVSRVLPVHTPWPEFDAFGSGRLFDLQAKSSADVADPSRDRCQNGLVARRLNDRRVSTPETVFKFSFKRRIALFGMLNMGSCRNFTFPVISRQWILWFTELFSSWVRTHYETDSHVHKSFWAGHLFVSRSPWFQY